MSTDWKAVCPNCHRSSSWVEDGSNCPYCGTCSTTFERWLEHHFKLGWLIAVVLVFILAFTALIIGISPAQASDDVTAVKQGPKSVIVYYPGGDYLIRKKSGNRVQITGVLQGKMVFDYKTSQQLKTEDLKNGIYHQVPRIDEED